MIKFNLIAKHGLYSWTFMYYNYTWTKFHLDRWIKERLSGGNLFDLFLMPHHPKQTIESVLQFFRLALIVLILVVFSSNCAHIAWLL